MTTDNDHEAGAEFDRLVAETKQRAKEWEARRTMNDNPRTDDLAALGLILHGVNDDDEAIGENWLVDEMLLTVGVALMSGQWGAYKTFVADDLAASVMTKTPFAGHAVLRQGGVLWLAAEGQSQVKVRIDAVALDKVANAAFGKDVKRIDPKRMPFLWRKSIPALARDGAYAELRTIIGGSARIMRDRFDLPLSLVVIDAVTSAGQFKDADNTSENARVFSMLAKLAQEFGLLILPIDHFGKNLETGTRNASTKEDFADAVLALLGERDPLTGLVANPRMALRKVRGAANGEVIPLQPRVILVGEREDGKPITTLVVDWGKIDADARPAEPRATAKRRWPPSLATFMAALENTLGAAGKRTRPFADSPELIAADLDLVRAEFLKTYVVSKRSADAKDRDAKTAAFGRCQRDAFARNLIVTREIGEPPITYVWRP
jgi:hypothetical protein